MTSARVTACVAWVLALVAAIVLAGCGGSSGPALRVFTATLTGAQEVPSNGSTAIGTGIITVDLDTMTLTASVVTAGIVDTGATLREGGFGTIGPVLLPLNKIAGSTVWTGGAVISRAQLWVLRHEADYFEVQSAAFPNGEIRGQLIEQLPTQDQWAQLDQARQFSPQLDQQLRLVENPDNFDWRFSGIGFGFFIGF